MHIARQTLEKGLWATMKYFYIAGNPESRLWSVEVINHLPDGAKTNEIYLADHPYKMGIYFPESRDSFPDGDDIWLILRKAMWTMRTLTKPQQFWRDELGKVKI